MTNLLSKIFTYGDYEIINKIFQKKKLRNNN